MYFVICVQVAKLGHIFFSLFLVFFNLDLNVCHYFGGLLYLLLHLVSIFTKLVTERFLYG